MIVHTNVVIVIENNNLPMTTVLKIGFQFAVVHTKVVFDRSSEKKLSIRIVHTKAQIFYCKKIVFQNTDTDDL